MNNFSTSLLIGSKGHSAFRLGWRRILPMSTTSCSLPGPSSTGVLLDLRQSRPGFCQSPSPGSVRVALAIPGRRSGSVPIVDDPSYRYDLNEKVLRTCTGYIGCPFQKIASMMAVLIHFLFHLRIRHMTTRFPACQTH